MKKYSLLTVMALLGWALLPASPLLAHSGHTYPGAWKVCVDKEPAAMCEYTNDHNELFKGTCQPILYKKICVRNQPIVQLTEPPKTTPDEASPQN